MNKAKTFDLISKGLGDGYLAARNLNSKDLEALLVDSLAEDHRWDQQLDSRLEYFISLFELLHRLPFQRIYDALFLREKHLKGGGETNIFSLKILAYGYFVEKEELCFELMKKYLLTSTCWSDLLSSVVFEDFLEKKESQKAKNFVNFVAKILAKKAIECPEKLSKFFLEIMHRETWYVDEWTKNLKVSSLVTKEKEVPVLSSPKSLLEAYQEIDLVGYFCAIKVISKKEAKTLAVEKELFNDYLKKIEKDRGSNRMINKRSFYPKMKLKSILRKLKRQKLDEEFMYDKIITTDPPRFSEGLTSIELPQSNTQAAVQTPPLPPQPAATQVASATTAPINPATGLTTVETALLSPSEQAIRLKQRV